MDRNLGFGHNITIQHDNGVRATYAHMAQAPSVRSGRVREGQTIGYIGNTGNAWAVGYHCHLQCSRNGVNVNPESLFTAFASGTDISPIQNGPNEDIRDLQKALNQLGYSLTEDGYKGANTITATKAFQRSNGLLDDGVAGVNTWVAIRARLAEKVAAEEAARMLDLQRKRTPPMFDIFWTTDGTGWLGTANGAYGLPNTQVLGLFQRRVVAWRDGKQEQFNLAEKDIMNAAFQAINASAATGVELDPVKFAAAVVDALPADLAGSATVDPEQLAKAMDAAVPRIVRALLKQSGELLSKVA